MLTGTHYHLRALEPEDLEFVYQVENDTTVWDVSHTQTPYSRFLIRQYLENAQQDVYEAKQLRLAIVPNGQEFPVGLIDLFDFDPQHGRAGVGILIKDPSDRGKGIGKEALGLLIGYAFGVLDLHQLYANIDPENEASVRLFATFGFVQCGLKRQWNRVGNTYRDEALFQLLNTTEHP